MSRDPEMDYERRDAMLAIAFGRERPVTDQTPLTVAAHRLSDAMTDWAASGHGPHIDVMDDESMAFLAALKALRAALAHPSDAAGEGLANVPRCPSCRWALPEHDPDCAARASRETALDVDRLRYAMEAAGWEVSEAEAADLVRKYARFAEQGDET